MFTDVLCSVKSGDEFEADFIEVCRKLYPEDAVPTYGTDIDYQEGTDMVLFKLPVDFTCNFAGKDHMQVLPNTVFIQRYGVDVKFGVRYGNSHNGYHEFKRPVLVIGIDYIPIEIRKDLDPLFEIISSKLDKIIDMGMDQYFEVVPD